VSTDSTRRGPYLMAGGLAGASAALALMLFFVVMLGIGALWQYAFNSSIPVIRDTAWAAVLQDVSRLPSFLWGWRWIVVALVAGGVLLSWLDRLAQQLPAPWHGQVAGAALMILSATAIIALLLINADSALFGGGGDSESLPSLGARRPVVWNLVLVGTVMSLAVGGAIWLYWSWWYRAWRKWMRLAVPEATAPAMASPDDWFARRGQLARARRVFIFALAGALLLTVGAVSLHEQVRAQVQSGEVWVRPDAPESTARFSLTQPERRLLVENTYGDGAVSVVVAEAQSGAPASEPAELTFDSGRISYQRIELDVGGLRPGAYVLAAQLRGGDGGRVGYALIQGNQPLAALVAALVGLGAGATLALVMLLFSTRMPKSGVD